ncbi:hypothetical protein [Deinococcus humi]|uniref:Head-tail adaptor n=1 Tax=Deinococcus humi TaxID=662880 RepID=A0A7W8NDC1_9DEIO|nr:hypothetical protein [Deinococcus humi]MBB5363089.1 head-tail adaptor [Deinococcus humi]
MTRRPRLNPVQPEAVLLLAASLGAPDALGERQTTYQEGPTVLATVTPISAEQAVRAGLTQGVTRLRVRLAAGQFIAPGDRLRLRGGDWNVVTADVRVSYTVAIVEEVP